MLPLEQEKPWETRGGKQRAAKTLTANSGGAIGNLLRELHSSPAEEMRRLHQPHKHQRITRTIPEASAGAAQTAPCRGWQQDCWRLLRSLSRAASSTPPPERSTPEGNAWLPLPLRGLGRAGGYRTAAPSLQPAQAVHLPREPPDCCCPHACPRSQISGGRALTKQPCKNSSCRVLESRYPCQQ